jgi:hypothetical protein
VKALAKTMLSVCRSLGLRCETDIPEEVMSLTSLKPVVWIALLGGEKGMLVFADQAPVDLGSALVESGYGFSTLDGSAETCGDIDSYIEMFSDWGWTGSEESRPKWLLEQDDLDE